MQNIFKNNENHCYVYQSALQAAIDDSASTGLDSLLREIESSFKAHGKFLVLRDVTTEVLRSIDRQTEFDEFVTQSWDKHREAQKLRQDQAPSSTL